MKPQLEEAARQLPNLLLLPLQPFERLGFLLGLADMHLLPQSTEAEDLVLPSKLTGREPKLPRLSANAGWWCRRAMARRWQRPLSGWLMTGPGEPCSGKKRAAMQRKIWPRKLCWPEC